MKHLKAYEDMNTGEPEIGDYVIINTLSPTGERYLKQPLSDFINNNIGEIRWKEGGGIDVKYFNIPEEIKRYFNDNPVVDYIRKFPVSRVTHWSKNKEELEYLITAKKYNL